MMGTYNSKSVKHRTTGVVACIAVTLGAALKISGCGWDYYTDHSVRFNGSGGAKSFARLPRLPNSSVLNPNKLFSWDEDVSNEETYKKEEELDKRIEEVWNAAASSELHGDLEDERKRLREYLTLTHPLREGYGGNPKSLQARRNSAFDKLDALTAVDQGSSKELISAYLKSRSAFDESKAPEEISTNLAPCRADRNLKDNAAYLEAAVFYRDHKSIGTNSFADVVRLYPKSEKRESALFMSAVSSMKASMGSLEDDPDEANVSLQDQEWQSARKGFQRLIREYSNGRYCNDARGWLAHLWLKVGERGMALADYYRMLASDDEMLRGEAMISIRLVRHKATESDLEKLEATIANEPRTAMSYAYHEIYNYTAQHRSSQYGYDDDKYDPKHVTNELQRIAVFATRMMSRYPATPLGGGFVLRVAEAQLELGNAAEACRLSRRALALGVRGDERAEALWVAGASEKQLGRYETATSTLKTLVNENPNNRYTEGGYRLLAIVLEETGNTEGALDAYLALDYRYDVAYYIDVLMTPSQLASFIEKRPSLNHRDELLYALGVRYLRDRKWQAAREVFLKIRTVGRSADEDYSYKRYGYGERLEQESPKLADFDRSISGVRPQWVEQDLRTANDLERLERQVELAQSDEGKAEALYQVASYQFERSLLFYNPNAWHGLRHYLLCDIDHDGSFPRPGESQLLFNYMQSHDMASNALPIYLEVVRRFPNTRAAKDALYTAAVCHQRLAEYNNYWRAIYAQGGHAGERLVNYKDVRAAYPKYSFPQGTFGWEPSTRTVNGGPGWEPVPKPKPRPSKWSRAAGLINEWINQSLKLFNRMLADLEFMVSFIWSGFVTSVNWVLHCCWILTMCGWLWFLWRRAKEARALMNEEFAFCKARPAEERNESQSAGTLGVFGSTLDKYIGHDIRDDILEAGRDCAYKLRQVAAFGRGRALIAFYAASHMLFGVLLIRLLVNW